MVGVTGSATEREKPDELLPPGDVVNAAVASTRLHLELLKESGGAEDACRAHDIRLLGADAVVLDDCIWSKYECRLMPNLSVWTDIGAVLRLDAAPAAEVQVHVLEYHAPTGRTVFAASSPVAGETGAIVFDFLWLVQRYLDWFEQRGASVKGLPQSVARPKPRAVPMACSAELTQEQQNAVHLLLENGLSYVWGPPGTGKTHRVLAQAVRLALERGETLLVAAPTNLALDNAIAATLELPEVSSERVIRIGVPSPEFVEQHPECCEERVFRREVANLRAELRAVEEELVRQANYRQAALQLPDWERDLSVVQAELATCRTTVLGAAAAATSARSALADTKARIANLTASAERSETELDKLRFLSVHADVKTLETEHARSLACLHEIDARLAATGLLTRVFTRRVIILRQESANQKRHVEAVEATLAGKRRQRDSLRPAFDRLTENLEGLRTRLAGAEYDVAILQRRVEFSEHAFHVAEEAVLQLEQRNEKLQADIHEARDLLSQPTDASSLPLADEQYQSLLISKSSLESRIAEYKHDLTKKSIIGVTLDGFVGLTMDPRLKIDRVVVDEAPYAPLAKVLPLLSLGCPIGMLGDHLQLPPVCRIENEAIVCSYWAKSAIFLEDAFYKGSRWHALNALKQPRLHLTQKAELHASYRFGPALARLLDDHIYSCMGLTGCAKDPTRIGCVHCRPRPSPSGERRENVTEADQILEWLDKWWQESKGQGRLRTVGVLTLYKHQLRLLRERFKERFGQGEISASVEIWNTHKAQGREWDCVLFSVCDTGRLPRNRPWWTDSDRADARPMLNTTISRAKKEIVFFLDCDYWGSRSSSLLADLACDPDLRL